MYQSIYLSMIRDLYDNSIVAYKTAAHQTVSLVLDTIRLAIVSGKEPYSERQYRNRMERIMKNIDLHGATAHVLRHTFCTMAAGHTDIKTLQTMAGHLSIPHEIEHRHRAN